MSDRRYRQSGYQDDAPRESRAPQQGPREKKEGPRGRGLGGPTETVFRCARCGTERAIADPIELDTACAKCHTDLHTCSNCIHFDTSVRWECRKFEEIPARIVKKSTRNECTFFTPKEAAESGRQHDRETSKDARSAFDALFKL
ncbi:MAG TPA: hypothetical protein VEW48_28245 [Thermoanaerobaculia bacterium]|nr:hypothetical protein [Thermoanaerobaculia bacterium]